MNRLTNLLLKLLRLAPKAMIYRVSKKFAKIQRTQKSFSGYIYLMYRVLAHVFSEYHQKLFQGKMIC